MAAVKCKDKDLFIVPGGDHNDTFLRAGVAYTDKLRQFMDRCTGDISRERSYEDVKGELEEEEEKYQDDQIDGTNHTPRINSSENEEEEYKEEGASSKVEDEDKDQTAKKED